MDGLLYYNWNFEWRRIFPKTTTFRFFQKQGFRVFFKGIYIGKFRKFQGLLSKLKNFFWQNKSIFRNISHSFISCCCSVTKLCLILHPSLPSPSLFPWVCSNSCPLSQWCHPTILCPPLLLSPSIFPSIWVFCNESVLCIRWSKYWSFTSVLLINIQDWFPLGLTDLISLLSRDLSRILSSTTGWEHQFFGAQPSLRPNSHIHTWLLEKP